MGCWLRARSPNRLFRDNVFVHSCVRLKGQPNLIFTKVDMEMLSVGMEMCSLESQAASPLLRTTRVHSREFRMYLVYSAPLAR